MTSVRADGGPGGAYSEVPMSESLQRQYAPNSVCFGCGPANPDGLHIESYLEGEEVVAEWIPGRHHEAFPGVLNGGIIGTLLDCHGNWTAAQHLMALRRSDRPPVTVTAEYTIRLLKPTDAAGPVRLVGRVIESSEDRATVEAELWSDGRVTATCSGLFVAVREGHPAYHSW